MVAARSDFPVAEPTPNSALTAIILGDELLATIAALLAELDQRETLALDFGRVGYIDGYAEGYRARMSEENREFAGKTAMPVIDGTTYEQVLAERWKLRGEQRTRETFGQPHPQDR